MVNLFNEIQSYINKKEKLNFNFIIILSILTSFLELISIAAIIPLVKIIVGNNDFSDTFFFKDLENYTDVDLDQKSLIVLIMVLILAIFIIKALVIFFCESFKETYLKNMHDGLSSKLYKYYINIDYQKLSNFKLSDKLRHVGQVGFIVSFLKSSYIFVSDIILFVFLISFLFFFNFKMTLILAIILSIIALIITASSKKKIINYSKIAQKNVSATYENTISALRSMKEIIILKRRSIFDQRFNDAIYAITKFTRKNNLLRFLPKIIYEVVTIFIIFLIIIFLLIDGKSLINNLEILAIYVVALLKIIPSFNKIVINYQNLNTSYAPAKETLDELKNVKSENSVLNREVSNKNEIIFSDKIKINNLSFSYENGKDEVLKNINLEIKKGDIIGFYGPSGGGKSTFINLLLGLLKPTKGNIIINSLSIEKNLNSWHNSVSYVPQDIFLLNDTIKNNILFGINESEISQNLFEKALEISNLNEFLDKTPEGLNTIVGENAIKLSGGQAQRICLARSLLKETKIIFLDEATSKLDEKNEYEILEKLISKLQKDKTLIIVSHRVNTLKTFSNKVYKIDNKNIKLEYEK
tara:strand:- start:101 stop:1849 length:1749 start_codon:yes stop_codon:yes gene_type:complete